jgi:hypothetical protein
MDASLEWVCQECCCLPSHGDSFSHLRASTEAWRELDGCRRKGKKRMKLTEMVEDDMENAAMEFNLCCCICIDCYLAEKLSLVGEGVTIRQVFRALRIEIKTRRKAKLCALRPRSGNHRLETEWGAYWCQLLELSRSEAGSLQLFSSSEFELLAIR